MRLLKYVVFLIIVFSASPAHAIDRGRIRGSVDFSQHVIAALDFIRHSDPEDYRLIRYVNLIEQNEKTWSWIIGYDGVCKVELNSSYATWKYDNVYQLAGDLVHEGSLCRDYFVGNTADVKADEMRALRVQRNFYLRSHAPGYLVDYMNDLIAKNWPWGK